MKITVNRFAFAITLNVLILASIVPFSCTAQKVIEAQDKHLQYMGRVGFKDNAAQLYWSGSSVAVNFTGTDISASMADGGYSYFYVIIDGKDPFKLKLDAGQKTYKLAQGLKPGKHSAELFKLTEFADGTTVFNNFQFNDAAKILPPPAPKKRKIEFYGNSITCGYAVEDFSGKDSYLTPYKNNYLSYAAITARHFDAQYSCISKSGIGVLISWFPYTMPDIYNLLDPNDKTSLWDFSKYTPDVVVINLFQNDSWLVHLPDNAQFKARFGATAPTDDQIITAYGNFVKSIRAKYPKTQIICALGSMDATRAGSSWPGYIEKAVAGLNDKKVFTHFFAYKNSPGHPSVKEQQTMADDLIAFIDKYIQW